MPGSKNSAQIHAQYLAPWEIYRQGITANDNLGSVASVTQTLNLNSLISAASSELWVTPERTAGTGTVTLTVVRVNEGSLVTVPYQVVAQQTLAAHKQEYRFTGILPGTYRVLVTDLTGGSSWILHTTYISKLAFASVGGGGGGGTVEVPTVPFTWTSGTPVEVQDFSEGAGWMINGNYAPFAGSGFTAITYTGASFSLLHFTALPEDVALDAVGSSTGGTLVIENCGSTDLNLFDGLTTLTTLTITTNEALATVTGFEGLTTVTNLSVTNNVVMTTLSGFSALTSATNVVVSGNTLLTTVSAFGALASSTSLAIKDNPALTSLSGITTIAGSGSYDFRNNALPEAEVDRLLAAAVAGSFTGTIWLNGTGNAAPSDPDGFADVATLRGAGAIVHVNGELNLQLRGGAGLGIGSGNVFGADRHVASGNVCFTTNGFTIYSIDTTDPDAPFGISSIGYNTGGGGGGATYTGPTELTVADFADPAANGVYTFVSADELATIYGAADWCRTAVYQNPSGYWFIISPATGGGNRNDIFGPSATWDGHTFNDNGDGRYVNYDPDPTVQNWREYSDQGTVMPTQPTITPNAGDIGDAAWPGGGGGGLSGSSVIAAMTLVGTNLFVLYEAGFLETLDVSDPSNMAWIGHCDPGFTSEIQCSAAAPAQAGYLYANAAFPGLADPGSILAYDISNPASVTCVARVRTPGATGGGGMVIIGTNLWVCDYFSKYQTGTAVYYRLDITDPPTMAIDDTIDCTEDSTPNTQNGGFIGRPFEPWGMTKSGNFLYVLDDYIIQVWDVSTPATPVHVDTVWNEDNWSDTEGFCIDESRGLLFNAISGYNGPNNRGGSVVAFTIPGNGIPVFATEIFPLGGGASRFGSADTTRKLIYGSVGGIFNIFSY